MRCTSPRTVGFKPDGKTLSWSPKSYSKEFATFQLPCGKCISCRLEYARQLAIRCVHEASMWQENCFITLTYRDEELGTGKLNYLDCQKFMKGVRNYRFTCLLNDLFPNENQKRQRKLWKQLEKEKRKTLYETIKVGFFVAGEYGEKNKRKHWHIIVFNWKPQDCVHKYTTERGDKVYSSVTLGELWPRGISEVGSVTFESAGYCARYAAKKLVHGKDDEHDYTPISKRSSKNAIGKRWIEKNWRDVFDHGRLVFKKGDEYIQCGIPRYYEKWFQKYKPEEWRRYVATVKTRAIEQLEKKEKVEQQKQNAANARRNYKKGHQITRNETRNKLLMRKFNDLQTKLKL